MTHTLNHSLHLGCPLVYWMANRIGFPTGYWMTIPHIMKCLDNGTDGSKMDWKHGCSQLVIWHGLLENPPLMYIGSHCVFPMGSHGVFPMGSHGVFPYTFLLKNIKKSKRPQVATSPKWWFMRRILPTWPNLFSLVNDSNLYSIYIYMVGGLEHFFFFHILGTIIPTD